LLLVASVAPVQAAPSGTYSGTWKGKTGQGEAITFKVSSGDVVKSLKVTYSIPQCGVTATTTLSKQSASAKSGKFTLTADFGTGGITVKGTMASAKKANGTLKASFTPVFGCQGSIKTSWSAKRS
jgi:hypothetical protein